MSYIGNNLQSGRSEVFHFTASGGESAITTSTDGRSLLYTVGWCSVYLNGVRLHESDFTATTGNSITGLSPALSANDVVIVEAAHTFSVDSSVPATGGTFSGNVTHSGNVTVATGKSVTAPSLILTPSSAPSSPSEGQTYYNNVSDTVFVYTGTGWIGLYYDGTPKATGGIVTYYGGFAVHTFLTSEAQEVLELHLVYH